MESYQENGESMRVLRKKHARLKHAFSERQRLMDKLKLQLDNPTPKLTAADRRDKSVNVETIMLGGNEAIIRYSCGEDPSNEVRN